MVSIVIPTFNRYHTLKRTLNSVFEQTYKNFEVILVDDGSTDDTRKIENEFDIIYIYQKNLGVSRARNEGIKSARGEWIAFLDSDDEWHTDKLQKQMNFFKNNPKIKFCHTKEKWIRYQKEVKYPKRLEKPSGWCFCDNLQTCKIAASSTVCHKEVFDKVGLFDENFKVCEDYDMWLRVAYRYKIGLIEENLITKYAGHNQLSNKIFAIDRYHIRSLLKFIDTPYHDEVVKMIKKKLEILKKGALKHTNYEMLKWCDEIVKYLKQD